MNRCCYKCGKDLSIEPAIKGLRGLLCFTCRYKLDEAGGERFVVETELYPERQAAWQAEFGKQWEMRSRLSNRLNRFSALAFISAGVILVALYFSIHFGAAPAVLYLGVLLIVDLCVCFGLSTLAEKCKGSPPPNKPQKNPIALSSEPTLLFDGNSNADLNPKFTHYRPCNPQDSPYPPDWNERRIKCFIRDNRQCRLCKEQKRNLQAPANFRSPFRTFEFVSIRLISAKVFFRVFDVFRSFNPCSSVSIHPSQFLLRRTGPWLRILRCRRFFGQMFQNLFCV
jgi:hypothetical protein